MKRRTFNALSLFTLGWGIASCQRGANTVDVTMQKGIEFSNTNASHATTKAPLNWMGHWFGEDQRETLVREVAQEFSFTHQDINLQLKFWEELGLSHKPGTAKLIAEMIRSGSINWDVIWLDENLYNLVAFELKDPAWGSKHLVNFAEVDGFTATQKTFILDDPAYRQQTGGILAGPYIEGYYHALFYNKVVADRLGIDIKPQGMTFEDFRGYIEAVDRYNRQSSQPIAALYESQDWTTLEMLFQSLAKSAMSDFSVAKAEVGSRDKNEAVHETFKALESLSQYKPLIASHQQNAWFDTRHLVLDDQALFYVNGTWMYSHWRGLDADKMSKMIPVELPTFKPTTYYQGGYITTWGVIKNSPNRDRAISLLMAWSTPSVAEKWVRYTRNPTGLRGNFAVAEQGSDVFETFQSNITKTYGSNVSYSKHTGYLFGQANRNLSQALEQKIRALLAGETTAKDAYQQIISQLS
jgi:Bacterial extracellular solute-binding protein